MDHELEVKNAQSGDPQNIPKPSNLSKRSAKALFTLAYMVSYELKKLV